MSCSFVSKKMNIYLCVLIMFPGEQAELSSSERMIVASAAADSPVSECTYLMWLKQHISVTT